MDLHHNLFYTYRGPGTDADRDRQLENNFTKALINTLCHGGEAVWRPFLSWLGIADATGAKFLLQRRDLPSGQAANRRHRVLLGISQQESKWLSEDWSPSADEERPPKDEGVPDGWIYGDGFAVLLESKVTDADFSREQMARHYALLRSAEYLPPKVIPKTWREIHSFFDNKLLPTLTEASSFLLVRQFIQFLEYLGMSGFTGFKRDHFDYFLLHDDDDARHWVHDQVEDFAARVQTRLQELDPFYHNAHPGNLPLAKSHCWAAFGPDPFKKCETFAHQTISISANGLRMFVNIETTPATNRLKKATRKDSREDFRKALQTLHAFEPFELVLSEVFVVRPRVLGETPKMRLHSSMLADETGAWTAFAETVQSLHLLYCCIDRPPVPPPKLIELSVDGAIELVVETFQHNHAVVKLLND
jgi:hypothetical protein